MEDCFCLLRQRPKPFEQSRGRSWPRVRFTNAVVPAEQEQAGLAPLEEPEKPKQGQVYTPAFDKPSKKVTNLQKYTTITLLNRKKYKRGSKARWDSTRRPTRT